MSHEAAIEQCVCGERAKYGQHKPRHTHWVECPRKDLLAVSDCWQGPVRRTREAAITAWNTLMRAAKERARLRDELEAAHSDIIDECGRVITADANVYVAEMPTEAAKAEWRLGERSPDTMPVARCTCPDCTEHRARVSAQEKETT